jgi:23S rRNA (pseudouridine1915-N3)-methyltransferase
MLNIIILTIGKIKESYFQEMFAEYFKRLKPYARIQLEELKAESFKSEVDKEKTKNLEGEKIDKFLQKHPEAEIVFLTENGKEYSSVEFAKFLDNHNRQLIFVVCGTLGPSKDILAKYKNKLSLSQMTFPHEMARVMLIEQIYRGVTIAKNKSYHY